MIDPRIQAQAESEAFVSAANYKMDPSLQGYQPNMLQRADLSGMQRQGPSDLAQGIGAAMQQNGNPLAPPQSPGAPGQPGEEAVTKSNVLWKPVSEKGGLAVLFPYKAGQVVIKDAKTGEILDRGVSSGASNGYADTVRFSRPGTAFNDVIIEDSSGKQMYVRNGGMRNENLAASAKPAGPMGLGQPKDPFLLEGL